jgi:queuine tRNA-ribosyltransferase
VSIRFEVLARDVHPDLRLRAAAGLINIGFDGYAVGGLAISEGQATTFAVLDASVPALPEDRPRYLMGRQACRSGRGRVARQRHFDCVLPTRSGRTGPECRCTEEERR